MGKDKGKDNGEGYGEGKGDGDGDEKGKEVRFTSVTCVFKSFEPITERPRVDPPIIGRCHKSLIALREKSDRSIE